MRRASRVAAMMAGDETFWGRACAAKRFQRLSANESSCARRRCVFLMRLRGRAAVSATPKHACVFLVIAAFARRAVGLAAE
eukprot:2770211-Pleurochrysis_carterae.AAC.2